MHVSVQLSIVSGAVILIAFVAVLLVNPDAEVTFSLTDTTFQYIPLGSDYLPSAYAGIPVIQESASDSKIDNQVTVDDRFVSKKHKYEISIPNTNNWKIISDENELRDERLALGMPVVLQIKSIKPDSSGRVWDIFVIIDEYQSDFSLKKAVSNTVQSFEPLVPPTKQITKYVDKNKGIAGIIIPQEDCIEGSNFCNEQAILISMTKIDNKLYYLIGLPKITNEVLEDFKISEDVLSIFQSMIVYP